MTDNTREAFEKLCLETGLASLHSLDKYTTEQFKGQYCFGNIQKGWVIWQASEAHYKERIAELENRLEKISNLYLNKRIHIQDLGDEITKLCLMKGE
jgi:hypothetical protein